MIKRKEMECIVYDTKGRGMLRYKGQDYVLFSTIEQARYHVEHNFPHSMHKDFTVIDWKTVGAKEMEFTKEGKLI